MVHAAADGQRVHTDARRNRPAGFRADRVRREPVEIRLIKDRSQWTADLIADGWSERDRVNFPLFEGFGLPDIANPS